MRLLVAIIFPMTIFAHDYCSDSSFEMERRIENRKIRILDGIIRRAENATINKDFWYKRAVQASVELACGTYIPYNPRRQRRPIECEVYD